MIHQSLSVLLLLFCPSLGFASVSPPSAELKAEASPKGTSWSGTVGLDSSSFFYRAASRGSASTTLTASMQGHSESKLIHSEGDLSLYSFVTNQPAFGLESRELFMETRPGVLGNFRLSFGRKVEDWSKLDGTWRMMSLWSPRWTWDELHPQVIGMTGLFLKFESSRFKMTFFGSPLAIPERGTPIEERDHTIVSSNPFWRPLPTELTVLGAKTPILYSLRIPDLQDILLRPNFALKARLDLGSGVFVSMNSGVLPVHMTQLAAEPFISGGQLEVNIRPQFPMRNINTVELGLERPDQNWNLWLSGSYEQPFQFENQETWLNPIITPSSIMSAGTSIGITNSIRAEGSLLFVHEQAFQRSSRVPDVNVQLPSRFPLKQALQLGGNWRFSDRTQSDVNWVHDLIQRNNMISMNVSHLIRSQNLSVGGGMDLILARSTQGWVGQYYGDDRIRGWLKYAF